MVKNKLNCQRLTFTPPQVFYKKGVLRYFTKFTGKYLCQSLFFNEVEACNFIKKETLAQVFSCGLCENSKNTFFTEHLWTTVLDFMLSKDQSLSNRDTAETSATRNPSWIFWKDHLVKMCFLTNLTNSFTL